MSGLFITFEGIDGSGKSTQGMLLAEALATAGQSVVHTREPGGTDFGIEIRHLFLQGANRLDGLTELFLMAADRRQHVQTVIRPALQAGAVVISERYTDSTEAYQGYGRGVPLADIRRANALATGGLAPDITFLLDMSPDEGAKRRETSADRIEAENSDFFGHVRRGYLALQREFYRRIILIDAALSPARVHEQIWRELEDRGLGFGG